MTHRTRPSVDFKPKLYRDGDQWCVLYGEDLQNGVSGFGDSPHEAMIAFDLAWDEKISMQPPIEKEPPVDINILVGLVEKKDSIAERAATRYLHGEFTGKENARLRAIIGDEVWRVVTGSVPKKHPKLHYPDEIDLAKRIAKRLLAHEGFHGGGAYREYYQQAIERAVLAEMPGVPKEEIKCEDCAATNCQRVGRKGATVSAEATCFVHRAGDENGG
jgi:hypothetical protein